MALKKPQKSLKKWTKQKWTTPSGKKSSETGTKRSARLQPRASNTLDTVYTKVKKGKENS
jgi:hypothetical protein